MKKTMLFFLFLIFTSCETFTSYIMIIDNQSDDTIKIVFSENSEYYTSISSHPLIFPPRTKKEIDNFAAFRIECPCSFVQGIKESEIEVHTSSGKKVKKDIWKTNNWDCDDNIEKRIITQTFVITEEDLK